VGICDCVEALRDGLGEGLDFSVTVTGEDFGLGLGLVRGPVWVVVVRDCVFAGAVVTVLPGVVTESEVAVVVVVSVSPLIRCRTKLAGASRTRNEVTATLCAARQPPSAMSPSNRSRFTPYLYAPLPLPARDFLTSATNSSIRASVVDQAHIKR